MQTTNYRMAEIKDIKDAPGNQNTSQSYHFGADATPAEVSERALQLANVPAKHP